MSDPLVLELPGEMRGLFAEDARSDEQIGRWLLGAAAIQAYNERRIGHGGVGKMLGFGWAETEAFLVEHKVPLNWNEDDIAQELAGIEMLHTRYGP